VPCFLYAAFYLLQQEIYHHTSNLKFELGDVGIYSFGYANEALNLNPIGAASICFNRSFIFFGLVLRCKQVSRNSGDNSQILNNI